jgi:uncharacterized protein YciI
MPHYAIYCTDAADGTALRTQNMPAHREHIARIMPKIMLAGPCPALEGHSREASLLVVEADDAAAARQLLESDPFYKVGVWEKIEIRRFNALAGAWAPKPVR